MPSVRTARAIASAPTRSDLPISRSRRCGWPIGCGGTPMAPWWAVMSRSLELACDQSEVLKRPHDPGV